MLDLVDRLAENERRGRHGPAHPKLHSRRVGDRRRAGHAACPGAAPRLKGRDRARRRDHIGHWAGRERAQGPRQCGVPHLPERRGGQKHGARVQPGRRDQVARRGGGRRGPRQAAGNQAHPRAHARLCHPGRRRRMRRGLGAGAGRARRQPRPPRGGPPRRGQLDGHGRARRRRARGVRGGARRVPRPHGRGRSGGVAAHLRRSRPCPPGAGRRGRGLPKGRAGGGSAQRRRAPRAGQHNDARRPARRGVRNVLGIAQVRSRVRAGVPLQGARAADAGGARPHARRRGLYQRAGPRSAGNIGVRGARHVPGGKGPARRGGRRVREGHRDRPRRRRLVRCARQRVGRVRPGCGRGRRVRDGDRGGRADRPQGCRHRPGAPRRCGRGQPVQPPEVQARRRFGVPWTGLRAVEGGPPRHGTGAVQGGRRARP